MLRGDLSILQNPAAGSSKLEDALNARSELASTPVRSPVDDDGSIFEGHMDVLLNRGGFMRDLSTRSQTAFDMDILKQQIARSAEFVMDNETRVLFDLPPIAPTETQLELPCVTTSGSPSPAPSSRSDAGSAKRFGSVGRTPLVRLCA